MADFSIVRLSPTADIPPFDCGNEDINDFLANDAVDYQEGLLAVTYLVMSNQRNLIINKLGGKSFECKGFRLISYMDGLFILLVIVPK